MEKYYLYKSDKPKKKYVLVMPDEKHDGKAKVERSSNKHYFGATGYRDYTLMHKKSSKFYEPSKEERNKVKERYLKRHANEPKTNDDRVKAKTQFRHTPSLLSDMILWNKPTIRESVKDYEKKFNVNVIIKSKKLK